MEIKIKKTEQVKNKNKVHVRTLITVEADGKTMVVSVPPGLTDQAKIKEYLSNFLTGEWRAKVAEQYEEAIKAASKR